MPNRIIIWQVFTLTELHLPFQGLQEIILHVLAFCVPAAREPQLTSGQGWVARFRTGRPVSWGQLMPVSPPSPWHGHGVPVLGERPVVWVWRWLLRWGKFEIPGYQLHFTHLWAAAFGRKTRISRCLRRMDCVCFCGRWGGEGCCPDGMEESLLQALWMSQWSFL